MLDALQQIAEAVLYEGYLLVRPLGQRELPAGVQVIDFGIRGFDLAYALLALEDLADSHAVLVDATPRRCARDARSDRSVGRR